TSICLAPMYLAEPYLRSAGFTDVQYIHFDSGLVAQALATNQLDFGMIFSGPLIDWLDNQQPVLILGGVHIGCFELFCYDPVHTILDLKGKSVAVQALGGPDHVFLASMAAYVGLDPNKDINWVPRLQNDAKQLFIDGKVDAFLAFPPIAQELHDDKIGQ